VATINNKMLQKLNIKLFKLSYPFFSFAD